MSSNEKPLSISKKAEEALAVGRGILLRAMPYMGSVLYDLRFGLSTKVLVAGVPTIGVTENGWILAHPDFVEAVATMRDADRIFAYLYAHEILHLVLRHGSRCRSIGNTHTGVDPRVWNVAADLTIEQILRGIKALKEPPPPLTGVRYEMFGFEPNLSTEEYYRGLQALVLNGNQLPGDAKCGSGAGNPFDGEANSTGEASGGGWSEAKKERVAKSFANACEAHQKSIGNLPAGLSIEIPFAAAPERAPWRTLFSSAFMRAVQRVPGNDYSDYSYPNRKCMGTGFGMGAPFMARSVEDKPRVSVVLDTSGSMSGKPLEVALSEIENIILGAGAEVRFICCDTEATDAVVVHSATDALAHLVGGGGTYLVPGITKATEDRDTDILVVMTDGYVGSLGDDPGIPTIAGVIGRPPYTVDCDACGWAVVVPIDE